MADQTTEYQIIGKPPMGDQTARDQTAIDQTSQDLPKWVLVALPVMSLLIAFLIVALCIVAHLHYLLPCSCLSSTQNVPIPTVPNQDRTPIEKDQVSDSLCQDSVQDYRIELSPEQATVVFWDSPRLIESLDSDDDDDIM
jgi:hypothetical protein